MDFSWALHEMHIDLERLNVLIEKESNPSKKAILSYYYAELKEQIIHEELPPNKVNRKIEYEDNVRYSTYQMPYIEPYMNIVNDFQVYLNEIVFSLGLTHSSNLKISNNDTLAITNDFYQNETNEYLYHLFKKLYAEKNNCFHFEEGESKHGGEVAFVGGLNKAYISVYDANNLNKVSSSIHEYGHGIAFLQYPLKQFIGEQVFTEIGSIFMELISDEYLLHYADKKDVYHNAYNRLLSFYRMSEDLQTINSLVNIYEGIGFPDFNSFKEKLDKEHKEISLNSQEIFINSDEIDILLRYILCYSISIELYEIYKLDKNKALDLYQKIMLLQNNPDEFTKITSLVTPNQHLETYTKRIINNL